MAIAAPLGGSKITTGQVAVKATARDAGAGVARVVFYACQSGVCTLIGSDTTAPYAVVWTTSALPNGSYSLQARAYDQVGNLANAPRILVTMAHATTTTSASSAQQAGPLVTETTSRQRKTEPAATPTPTPRTTGAPEAAPRTTIPESSATTQRTAKPQQDATRSPSKPTVSLSATSGQPGNKVEVTGAGFAPGRLVLSWDGRQWLGTVTVRADGTFQATVTVPAKARSGAHRLQVTDARGSRASVGFRVRKR